MNFLSDDRAKYYQAKKAEAKRKTEARKVVKDDAVFIRYYGMSAYLELFPEAKDFGTDWHNAVIDELRSLEKKHLANSLSGMALAIGANLSKKVGRKFRRVIKDMYK